MKLVSLLLLSLLVGKGCSREDQEAMNKAKIEYTTMSRGVYERIEIEDKKVAIYSKSKDTKSSEKVMSNDHWKELVALFSTVELEKLNTYKDPTQKRRYDGALIAQLKITYKEKEYQSVEFDHGNPPEEIQKVVNQMLFLIKKE